MRPDPPRGFGDHTTAAEKNPAGNTDIYMKNPCDLSIYLSIHPSDLSI